MRKLKNSPVNDLKPTQLRQVIEEIREALANRRRDAVQVQEILEKHGIPALIPCGGEAHSNACIDNCMVCAPRWGWVEPPKRATSP